MKKSKNKQIDGASLAIGFGILGAVLGIMLASTPNGQKQFRQLKNEFEGILAKQPKPEDDGKEQYPEDLEELKALLLVYVGKEQYEKCAKIRDKIKALEKK